MRHPFKLLVFFFALASSPSAAQNLLANGGFESGSAGPSSWMTWPAAPPGVTYRWSANSPHSGTRCVEISSNGPRIAMWRQVVAVSSGALYTFSGWVEMINVSRGSRGNLQAVFRNAAGQVLAFVNLPAHSGTITPWMYDFPHEMTVRAPKGATKAEVNLFLQGYGTARFDDVFFGPVPAGDIAGFVSNGAGPIAGAEVELWGTGRKTTSDSKGHFLLAGVPDASPRWTLIVRAKGYRDATLGGIDVQAGRTTSVAVLLRPGSNPQDMDLQVRAGRLAHIKDAKVLTVDPQAVIDKSVYPAHVLPFLKSHPLIDADSPEVKKAAAEIMKLKRAAVDH